MDTEEKGTSERNENRITCRVQTWFLYEDMLEDNSSTKNECKVDIRKENVETIWNRVKESNSTKYYRSILSSIIAMHEKLGAILKWKNLWMTQNIFKRMTAVKNEDERYSIICIEKIQLQM